MIFDSHAHYDDEAFDSDRESVIKEIHENGVIGVLDCGSSIESSEIAVRLSKKYDFFYAAVGVHPESAADFDEDAVKEIYELSHNDKVKAIGEIGLDYHYEDAVPKDLQKKVFIRQMKIAEDLHLPVVIHDRDAHLDTYNVMKIFPKVRGVVHCFSGSPEFAKECFKLGYYIGFTGVVTFKNSKKAVNVLKEAPLDRILVETDCPYMAPVPLRGKRNRSDYIKYIIEKMSEVRGISTEEIERITRDNIERLLNIDNCGKIKK